MRASNPAKEFTEQEAADSLGIHLSELHRLLDQHIFNNGTARPQGLLFTYSDILLLSFWSDKPDERNVIRMPRRR